MTTTGMKGKCNIPWNSNSDMLQCMENNDKRKVLLEYCIAKKFQDSRSVNKFMDLMYSEEMRMCIHSIE